MKNLTNMPVNIIRIRIQFFLTWDVQVFLMISPKYLFSTNAIYII